MSGLQVMTEEEANLVLVGNSRPSSGEKSSASFTGAFLHVTNLCAGFSGKEISGFAAEKPTVAFDVRLLPRVHLSNVLQ